MCRIEEKELKLDTPTNYMMRGKKSDIGEQKRMNI